MLVCQGLLIADDCLENTFLLSSITYDKATERRVCGSAVNTHPEYVEHTHKRQRMMYFNFKLHCNQSNSQGSLARLMTTCICK